MRKNVACSLCHAPVSCRATLPQYSLVRLSRTVQLATPSLVESSIAVLVFASDWTTEQQC